MPTTCIDCGVIIPTGNRCKVHKRIKERNRGSWRIAYRDPFYLSYVKASNCAMCGTTEDLEKDHIIPLSKGGTNHPSNLQTLCGECNPRKSNKM